MKRTDKKKTGEILWRKVGGGSFHLKNRIIKPGQTFFAHPDTIPEAFRDVLVAVDEIPQDEEVGKGGKKFKIVPIEDSELVNIVDGDEKVINEKELSVKEAKKLIKELEK